MKQLPNYGLKCKFIYEYYILYVICKTTQCCNTIKY